MGINRSKNTLQSRLLKRKRHNQLFFQNIFPQGGQQVRKLHSMAFCQDDNGSFRPDMTVKFPADNCIHICHNQVERRTFFPGDPLQQLFLGI